MEGHDKGGVRKRNDEDRKRRKENETERKQGEKGS